MALSDYFILAITLIIIIAVVFTITFIIAFSYFKLRKLFLKRKIPKDLFSDIKKEVLKDGNKSQENRAYEPSGYNSQDRAGSFRGFEREPREREQQFKEPTNIKGFDSRTMGDSRKFKFSE